ncbi:hypothetical protein STEG23_034469 [Scotinomys teguina]
MEEQLMVSKCSNLDVAPLIQQVPVSLFASEPQQFCAKAMTPVSNTIVHRVAKINSETGSPEPPHRHLPQLKSKSVLARQCVNVGERTQILVWYYKPAIHYLDRKFTSLNKEATVVVWLNGHYVTVKRPSK